MSYPTKATPDFATATRLRGNGGMRGVPALSGLSVVPDVDEGWKAKANCRNAPDPDIWFPGRGESPREAKEICRACPVREACLDYAFRHNEHHGIWGGISERERRRMRRARRQP